MVRFAVAVTMAMAAGWQTDSCGAQEPSHGEPCVGLLGAMQNRTTATIWVQTQNVLLNAVPLGIHIVYAIELFNTGSLLIKSGSKQARNINYIYIY